MKRYFVLVIALLLTLSACSSSSGDIEVHNAWVRPTAKGENAAVYLTLHNHSSTADELIGASSNVADSVELHESTMENDVMQMHRIDSVPLAADEEIMLEPGGLHVMLIGLKQDLVLGEHISVVLHFKNHEDIAVEVHIEDQMPDENHMHEEGETPHP
jgi:hypothetical protein